MKEAFDGKSQRARERLKLQLLVRVHGRESADHDWLQLTRLLDVSPFGARFSLARPTETGRLLQLTLPMPRQLRCFDHVEDKYCVWALVRHAKAIAPEDENGAKSFEVGVAFTGKHPPASFMADPSTRYEVTDVTKSGLWGLREQPEGKVYRPPTGTARPETRLSIPVMVIVETFDEKGEVLVRESTVTENISRRGAAVFTSLEIERGRFVRLSSADHQISIIAAVRARRVRTDGIPRLHLEFIDQQWPLEGVE